MGVETLAIARCGDCPMWAPPEEAAVHAGLCGLARVTTGTVLRSYPQELPRHCPLRAHAYTLETEK